VKISRGPKDQRLEPKKKDIFGGQERILSHKNLTLEF